MALSSIPSQNAAMLARTKLTLPQPPPVDPLVNFAKHLLRYLKARGKKEEHGTGGDAVTSPSITGLQTLYLALNFTQRQRVLDFIMANICRYAPVDEENESAAWKIVHQFDQGEVDSVTNTVVRPCSIDYLAALFIVYRRAQVLSDLPDGCNNAIPKKARRGAKSVPLNTVQEMPYPLALIVRKSEYSATAIAAKFSTEPTQKILKHNLAGQPMGRITACMSETSTKNSLDEVPVGAQDLCSAFSLASPAVGPMTSRSAIEGQFITKIKDLAWNLSMKNKFVREFIEDEAGELSRTCRECLLLEFGARESIFVLLAALCRIVATPGLANIEFFAMLSLLDSPGDPFDEGVATYTSKACSVDIKSRYLKSHREPFTKDNTKDNRPWEQFLKNGAPGFPHGHLRTLLLPGIVTQMVPASAMRIVSKTKDEYFKFLAYIEERQAVILKRKLSGRKTYPPKERKEIPTWRLRPRKTELIPITPNPFPVDRYYRRLANVLPHEYGDFTAMHDIITCGDEEPVAPWTQDSTRFATATTRAKLHLNAQETFEGGINPLTDPY